MVAEGNTENKRRKVFYDEFTNGFYVETRVAAVQRSCNYRSKITVVRNRSQDERCKDRIQFAETAKHIFETKYEKEETQHHGTLRDNAAYRQVLVSVAKDRENNHADDLDLMGKYGPGATRDKLDTLVQEKIEYMTPAAKRKRRAKRILSKRKKEDVFDRKATTPELFNMVRNRESRSASPTQKASSRVDTKLVLPPIEVSVPRYATLKAEAAKAEDKADGLSFPSVFVTQKSFHKVSD